MRFACKPRLEAEIFEPVHDDLRSPGKQKESTLFERPILGTAGLGKFLRARSELGEYIVCCDPGRGSTNTSIGSSLEKFLVLG